MSMKRSLMVISIALLVAVPFVRSASAEDADTLSAAEHKKLFREGAKLWPVYCNTCHNARPGSEKAPYEWDAIVMHMRTLGNLPPDDAKAILEYLKTR